MDRHIKIGLMDADDGVSVVVYGKPSWLYGPWERRFSSLLDAYRAISEEIPGIAFHEVAALYKPKAPTLCHGRQEIKRIGLRSLGTQSREGRS